jgi:hypothetical protein
LIASDAMAAGSVRRYFGGAAAIPASCSKLQFVSAAWRFRRVAERECVGRHRFGPECDGLDGALFGAEAPGASRIVERLNAGVPFVGWA